MALVPQHEIPEALKKLLAEKNWTLYDDKPFSPVFCGTAPNGEEIWMTPGSDAYPLKCGFDT